MFDQSNAPLTLLRSNSPLVTGKMENYLRSKQILCRLEGMQCPAARELTA